MNEEMMRKALVEELMQTLKIPAGNFNFSTISDEIQFIPVVFLRNFYRDCFTQESYGNGMKAIIAAAAKYKPRNENHNLVKAKELISLVETLNSQIQDDARAMGVDFVRLVHSVRLPTVSGADLSVLDAVAPYFSFQSLIAHVRDYRTSVDAVSAFIAAIEQVESRAQTAINHPGFHKLQLQKVGGIN